MAGFSFVQYSTLKANDTHKRASSHQSFAKTIFLHSTGADVETRAMNTAITAPAIRATHLISIPYGFQTPLPILDSGREVKASGHGGCTAGEQVTVAITITQSTSGAIATGENEHTCTGQLQTWSSVVTADTPSDFVDGAGEACGFATSRDGSDVTDTYKWCRDVVLATLNEQIYLPMVVTN